MTALQEALLSGFFARERRFFLTGGAALAGFYLGHRSTEDLDLFSSPGPALDDAVRALEEASLELGASVEHLRSFADFKRLKVSLGEESCIVDLVIDRAPVIETEKATFGAVRVDTLREIAANKVCTLVGRSEIKDLVDLAELLRAGVDLDQALTDAQRKDGGVEPVALAWVLDQLSIGPEARLPSDARPEVVLAFREELVKRLRAIAYGQARGDT